MRYLLPRVEELPLWPAVAAPVFLLLFIALVWWTYRRERRKMFEDIEKLPLED